MSNGAQCCALEICCPPEMMLLKLPAMIAKHTGIDEAQCKAFVEHVRANRYVFAPKSFERLAAHHGVHYSLPPAQGYTADFAEWMAHEELTFAPEPFSEVLQDIVHVVRKNGASA